MSISAQTIISLAEADVGQRETAGANRSPWLDPLQARVSTAHGWAATWLRGQPWCGTWAYDVLTRAGVAHADNPAHPSTETMWVRAQAAGTLTTRPVPGCLIIWRGIHTGIVVAVADQVVHTIEGNSGDAVTRRVRPLTGTHRYIVPRWLTRPTITEHWLEDLAARYEVLGPWRRAAWRDRALTRLTPARRRRATPVTTGDGRHAIRVQSRHYGPWATDAARRRAQTTLETRLGRRLRRWNRTRPQPTTTPAAGAAEALGKTT